MTSNSPPSNDWSQLAAAVGGLAHEIRNPLSTIKVTLDLLKEDWQPANTPVERRSLKKIDKLCREISRLDDTLNSFLRFVRIDHVELARCDVNELVNDLARFAAPEAASRGIDIVKFLDANLPPAMLDAGLFKQALLNILINAEQAMEGGGQIEVRTARDADRGIRIEFTDTGQGIAPEVLPRIFDAYYSTKKSGTGLGLPTARRIVERHGGTIEAQSEPGRGSRFVIHLPQADAAAQAGPEHDR